MVANVPGRGGSKSVAAQQLSGLRNRWY